MPSTIKADLHYHGPIGFQDYWLKVQGYQGKNLLHEIVSACFRKDISLCAITSDEDSIPRNSIHDRYHWLVNNCVTKSTAGLTSASYKHDRLGENISVFTQGDKKLYLVNGQTVRTKEVGKTGNPLTKKGYVDYLVVGRNDIENHKPLEETVKYVYDTGVLIAGAEHALCESHGGMGKEKLERLLPYMDFIEGHNSQLILPIPKGIPFLSGYRRGLNKESQHFANERNKPWIATSDGHRIKDVGISYIEFDANLLNDNSEEDFMKSFKQIIESRNFRQSRSAKTLNPVSWKGYENFFAWTSWVFKMVYGVKIKKVK